jgi:hypothetical protein
MTGEAAGFDRTSAVGARLHRAGTNQWSDAEVPPQEKGAKNGRGDFRHVLSSRALAIELIGEGFGDGGLWSFLGNAERVRPSLHFFQISVGSMPT